MNEECRVCEVCGKKFVECCVAAHLILQKFLLLLNLHPFPGFLDKMGMFSILDDVLHCVIILFFPLVVFLQFDGERYDR